MKPKEESFSDKLKKAAHEQHIQEVKGFARMLRYAADCIDYYLRMSKLPTCNTCGNEKACGYKPALGEPVRVNCPFWKYQERSNT